VVPRGFALAGRTNASVATWAVPVAFIWLKVTVVTVDSWLASSMIRAGTRFDEKPELFSVANE
jgi:hypothetical protein